MKRKIICSYVLGCLLIGLVGCANSGVNAGANNLESEVHGDENIVDETSDEEDDGEDTDLPEEALENADEYEIYTSKNYGFSIPYPKGFVVESEYEGIEEDSFDLSKDGDKISIYTTSKDEIGDYYFTLPDSTILEDSEGYTSLECVTQAGYIQRIVNRYTDNSRITVTIMYDDKPMDYYDEYIDLLSKCLKKISAISWKNNQTGDLSIGCYTYKGDGILGKVTIGEFDDDNYSLMIDIVGETHPIAFMTGTVSKNKIDSCYTGTITYDEMEMDENVDLTVKLYIEDDELHVVIMHDAYFALDEFTYVLE